MTIDEIECPYCGHKWRPSKDLASYWVKIYPDDVAPEICRACSQVYKIEMTLRAEFRSGKL